MNECTEQVPNMQSKCASKQQAYSECARARSPSVPIKIAVRGHECMGVTESNTGTAVFAQACQAMCSIPSGSGVGMPVFGALHKLEHVERWSRWPRLVVLNQEGSTMQPWSTEGFV